MAYIPPHKRQSNRNPTPSSPSISSKNKTLTPKPFIPKPCPKNPYSMQARNIVYSPQSISRWYHTSSETEDLPLVPYNCETIERNNGAKPLMLTVSDEADLAKEEERRVLSTIVEKIVRDLVETSRYAMEERENTKERERADLVKLSVVARVGKILFNGNSLKGVDAIREAARNEAALDKKNCKSFNTNMPDEHIRNIEEFLVQKCGFQFESEKEHYHIKVFDKERSDSIISCKCIVSQDGNLELYKTELNQLRYMVTDISCLQKDFDLRIMLNTKRILKNLDADVANGIDQLIKAAVINPEVKGGLRWPLGKESFSERFFVVGVWNIKYKNLRREKIRVMLRHADRFDQSTSRGEASNELSFKLTGVSELLTESNVVKNTIVDIIQEAVELIWENSLSNSGF